MKTLISVSLLLLLSLVACNSMFSPDASSDSDECMDFNIPEFPVYAVLQALDDPKEFMEEAQIYPEGLPGAIQYAAENRDLLDNQNDDVKHTFLCSVEVYRAYYPEGDYATLFSRRWG